MNKPQTITTPAGEELVVMLRADYDELLNRAGLSDEDMATAEVARIFAATEARRATGEPKIPQAVVDDMLAGTHPVRAVRVWRGMNQADTAKNAGISQPHLSHIERGKVASVETMRAIADALAVPVSLLID